MSDVNVSDSDDESRTYSEELVTPELAAEYLAKNPHNRKIKQGRILGYADQMKQGKWRANGDSLKFGKSGNLLDGQNRLHAVILAGVPVLFLVARGIEDIDQKTMDIGCQRSLLDLLVVEGEKARSTLAATIRALYLRDHTEDVSKRVLGGTGRGGGTSMYISSPEYLEFFQNNAELIRFIANRADKFRKKTKVPVSVLAPIIREMFSIDSSDAEDFLHRFENMMPSPRNYGEFDPLTQLHKTMKKIYDQDNKRSRYNRYNPTEIGALIIKSWNAYRCGDSIRVLYWRSGGSSPESFPVMK